MAGRPHGRRRNPRPPHAALPALRSRRRIPWHRTGRPCGGQRPQVTEGELPDCLIPTAHPLRALRIATAKQPSTAVMIAENNRHVAGTTSLRRPPAASVTTVEMSRHVRRNAQGADEKRRSLTPLIQVSFGTCATELSYGSRAFTRSRESRPVRQWLDPLARRSAEPRPARLTPCSGLPIWATARWLEVPILSVDGDRPSLRVSIERSPTLPLGD